MTPPASGCGHQEGSAVRPRAGADVFYVLATIACLAIVAAVVLKAGGSRGAPPAPAEQAHGRKPREPFTRPDVPRVSKDTVLERHLSLMEARHYRKLDGGETQCELCPTLCRLRDGERGQCKVRVNYSGILYTLVYGRLVAEHVDPIEKKPLHHFLPATRVYSIATVGCNFGCVFCQNWQISQAFPEESAFEIRSPDDVVALAVASGSPSIAYTYTEPSVFFEFMIDCARAARARGLANVWVTCGYLNEKPLREFAKFLDAANVDIKGFDDVFYEKWCQGQLAPVLRTIEVLKEARVHIEITNLLVPGGNDDPEAIRKLCRWVCRRVGPQTPVHFTRYHPSYKLSRPGPTPLETLRRARDIAREEGLVYVYVGNIDDVEGVNTRCARCRRLLVKRQGFYVETDDVKEGLCPDCGARIPGVWAGARGNLIRVPVDEPLPPRKGG